MSIGLYFKNDVKLNDLVKITLNSGAVHTGKVISYDDNLVLIETNGRPKPINFNGIADYEIIENNYSNKENNLNQTVFEEDIKASIDFFNSINIEYEFSASDFSKERKLAKDNISDEFLNIENSFLYAVRLNELAPKFGRMDRIIASIKHLQESNDIDFYNYALGEVYFVCGNFKEAADYYYKAKKYLPSIAMYRKYNNEEGAMTASAMSCLTAENITETDDIFKLMVVNTERIKDISILNECFNKNKDNLNNEIIKLLTDAFVYFSSLSKISLHWADTLTYYSHDNLLAISKQLAESNVYKKDNLLIDLINNEIDKIKDTYNQNYNNEILSGRISRFNPLNNTGFISTANDYIFFHISEVSDDSLKSSLTNGSFKGIYVEFSLSERFNKKRGTYGKVAVDVHISNSLPEKQEIESQNFVGSIREGYINSYTPNKEIGSIYSGRDVYTFLLNRVSDKALAGKLSTDYDISGIEVSFETSKLPSGKVVAINVKPKNLIPEEVRKSYENFAPKVNKTVYKNEKENILNPDKKESILLSLVNRNPNNEKHVADLITFYLSTANQDPDSIKKALRLVENHKRYFEEERVFLQYIRIYEKARDYEKLLKYYNLVIQNTDAVNRKLHYLNLKADILSDSNKGCLDYKKAIETYQEWIAVKNKNKVLLGIKDDYTGSYASIELNIKRRLAVCYLNQNYEKEAKEIASEIMLHNPTDQIAAGILQGTYYLNNLELDEQTDADDSDLYYYDFELNDIMQNRLSDFKLSVVLTHVNDLEDEKLKGNILVARNKIRKLEDSLNTLNTQRPKDYRNTCLAIAKIIDQYMSKDTEKDRLFNKKSRFEYMIRSLVAEGDLSVKTEEVPIDAARYLYLESSAEIEQLNQQLYINAYVRYIVSFFVERKDIPIGVTKTGVNLNPTTPLNYFSKYQLNDSAENFVNACTMLFIKKNNLINQICQQICESKNQELISSITEVFETALGIENIENINAKNLEDLWNKYIFWFKQRLQDFKQAVKEIDKIEFSTFWLEHHIEKLEQYLRCKIILAKDNERMKEVIGLLNIANRFVTDKDFDNRETALRDIIRKGQSLEKDIFESPTPFAFDTIRQILPEICSVAERKLNELFIAYKPELSVEIINSNTFLNNRECELRFVLKNKLYCQTVREIDISSTSHSSCITRDINKDYIKGGNDETLIIAVKPTDEQISKKAFQFNLTISYKYLVSPNDTIEDLRSEDFSINLFKEADFIEINNPYSAIDTSGEVRDENMFFGRDEFISGIVNTLKNKDNTLLRSKCIALFGQKRAGKSSILYHLENRIKSTYKNSIVIKLGNIQNILSGNDSKSVIISFRHRILTLLNEKLEDHFPELLEKMESCNISFPTIEELTSDIGQSLFISFFESFNKKVINKDYNIVVLIDEFTYVYGEIKKGKLDTTFMQLWKAMIQDLELVGILVGQDYMEKFINDFANPFGTVKKERVTYLSRESTKELCELPIQIIHDNGERESRYKDEKSFERIWQATAGSAFYTVKICSALVNYLNEKKSPYIVEADIKNVINNILMQDNGRLSESEFDALFNDEGDIEDKTKKEDNIKILKKIAQMSQKDDYCLRSDIICDLSEERVDMLLQLLCDRDVLEQKENKYKIKVGLYKDWLIKKYGGNN